MDFSNRSVPCGKLRNQRLGIAVLAVSLGFAFTIPGFVAIPFDEIGIEADPLEIFADRFESGDAGRWILVVP